MCGIIVVDCRMINSSGIGTYLKELIRRLIENVELVLIGNLKDLEIYGKKAKIIHFDAPIYSLKELLFLPFIIPKCDVFWSPHFNVPITSFGKAKHKIVTIHDVFHLAHLKLFGLVQRLYAKLFYTKAANCDRIITVSEFSKNEIVKYLKIDRDKINVILNGVNVIEGELNILDISSKFNISKAYFLCVGNVKPHKNISRLIEAYRLLPPELKEKYQMLIVGKIDGFKNGESTLFETNRDLVENENINFLGYVSDEDLSQLYLQSSFLVFPSTYEGFGLPLLEAMSFGIPVACSDIPPFKEVSGDAAIYFNPFNPESIAAALSEMLNEEATRSKLSIMGRAQTAKFSWEISAKEHEKLILDMVKRR